MQISTIQSKIHEIRGIKVMLDFDLALLYEVETRTLKQSVKRNMERFPADFLFQLTDIEWKEVITISDNLPENIKFSPVTPLAFTEQGLAMLSSVLRSKKAILVNVAIMRTFVMIRQFALSHEELTQKLMELETRFNLKFKDVAEAINYLLQKDQQQTDQQNRKKIGFK